MMVVFYTFSTFIYWTAWLFGAMKKEPLGTELLRSENEAYIKRKPRSLHNYIHLPFHARVLTGMCISIIYHYTTDLRNFDRTSYALRKFPNPTSPSPPIHHGGGNIINFGLSFYLLRIK